MVPPVLEATIAQIRTSTHFVTLVNPVTGDESFLTVNTLTGSFSEVLTATNVQRKAQRLFGYEIFESLPC